VVRAMVLTAGRGERLRPLTNRLPKPLIPLDGKPLIHYTLTYLRNCGIREVVMNLHHLGEQIQAYVGDGSPWDLSVSYSRESVLLGTGGGIQKAAPFLVQDVFVVMNADVVLELDLREVLRFHRRSEAVVTLVLRKDPEVDRYGAIEIDVDNRVRQFLGKIPIPRAPWRKLMFTGVHILEPAVFSFMPARSSVFSITDVYIAMIRAGQRIMGYEMKGWWTDLGTLERYEEFQRLLASDGFSLERFVRGCCTGDS
jgi:NDP-sugar pyrophosphorylase family protein